MRRLIDASGAEPEFFCGGGLGLPRLRILEGAVVMRANPASGGAAGVNPMKGECFELFEVLGRWPDVTARGSFLKVVNLTKVRETPTELRLSVGEQQDFLDPEGVVLVGGALVERDVRRGKPELVVKWSVAAALAARALNTADLGTVWQTSASAPIVWPTPSIQEIGPPGAPARNPALLLAGRAAAGRGEVATPTARGAASIPSRVRADGDYDESGRACGAYEQCDPPSAGQAAIRDRTDALQRSLLQMAVGRTEQKCVQSSLVCDGCDRPILPGEMMIQVGSRWAHADAGCELSGEARHQARVRAELRESAVRPSAQGTNTGPAPANSTAGHTVVKKARAFENTYSRDRLDACQRCMEGECGHLFNKLFCDSCERGLHRECAQLSRTATLGKMRCSFCRMDEMRVSQPAGQMVVDMCVKRVITELSSRLESTAQGHLSIERLQTDFLNSKLEPGASMIKPVDHEESFCAMLEWMVESGRGHRLESFLISVTAYFKDTHRPDLTKTETVKTTLRKMKELNPTRSLPKTTGTSELLKETLEGIADLADTPFLAARETFTTALEAMSGLRCGEVFGAQMGHGVMANGVRILTWKGGGGHECPPGVEVDEQFVEAATETSKTKPGRCVSMVGTSKGPAKVELAASLRNWWAACDFHIESHLEEGWLVEGPNFWVVQIPLMGVSNNETKMEKIRAWLGTGPRASSVAQVTEVRKELATELGEKARIKEPEVEKMFLNVLGMKKGDPMMEVARGELKALGITTELTKGPLIFKTKGKARGAGGDSKWIPQALQATSTYPFLHRAIDAAYARLKDRDPDFEMRLGGDRDKPHFAHNTWRRLAATAAQACSRRARATRASASAARSSRAASTCPSLVPSTRTDRPAREPTAAPR